MVIKVVHIIRLVVLWPVEKFLDVQVEVDGVLLGGPTDAVLEPFAVFKTGSFLWFFDPAMGYYGILKWKWKSFVGCK